MQTGKRKSYGQNPREMKRGVIDNGTGYFTFLIGIRTRCHSMKHSKYKKRDSRYADISTRSIYRHYVWIKLQDRIAKN